ncbi:MAG: tetratricopeptide repeat protein [Caulobacteraceae bacterium]
MPWNAILALGVQLAAFVTPAPPPPLERAAVLAVETGTPARDSAVAEAARRAYERGGFRALAAWQGALERVAGEAPGPSGRLEPGDGQMIYWASDRSDCLRGLREARAATSKGGPKQKDVCRLEPWTEAAMMAASLDDQRGRYAQAIALLDEGLAAAPNDPDLSSEKGFALEGLHRPAEALKVYRQALAAAPPAADDRARLMRGEAYALTGLGRLDEALETYRQSLKLEPGDAVAQDEIAYIEGLKAETPAGADASP